MSMMSPPLAANDVSPLTLRNDVAHCTRNDAMFAPMCPQAHIIAEGSIMCEARIICPTGQTSCKKASFVWQTKDAFLLVDVNGLSSRLTQAPPGPAPKPSAPAVPHAWSSFQVRYSMKN